MGRDPPDEEPRHPRKVPATLSSGGLSRLFPVAEQTGHEPRTTDGGVPVGDKQDQTKQTTGKDWSQGQGSQNKGQGQYRGQGQPMNQGTGQSDWNDRSQRPMQQGDETKPAQPSGTSPLDKDDQYANKSRPGQQNR
jgi:hypothetical protein